MMGYKRLAAPVVVFMMLIVVGCGGGSTNSVSHTKNTKTTSADNGGSSNATEVSTNGSGKALSRAELIAKAEVVCRRLNSKVAAINSVINTMQQVTESVHKRAPLEQAAVTELTSLIPPPSLARNWEQILSTRRLLVEDLNQIAVYAQANDAKNMYAVLRTTGGIQDQLAAAANRDGLKECARVG